jgi:hypothetical protein
LLILGGRGRVGLLGGSFVPLLFPMRKRLSAGALIESMAPILGKLQPLHAQYRGRIKLTSHRITSDVFPNLMNQQISFPSVHARSSIRAVWESGAIGAKRGARFANKKA